MAERQAQCHARLTGTSDRNLSPVSHEGIELNPSEGKYGVNIPKGMWHNIESLEPDSVFFECKEGPFVPHEVDGILELPKQ